MTRWISSTRAVTRAAPELEQVVLPLDHRLLAEPEQADAQPGGDLGARLMLQRRQLAAGDVDLLLQGEADGPAGLGAGLRRRG